MEVNEVPTERTAKGWIWWHLYGALVIAIATVISVMGCYLLECNEQEMASNEFSKYTIIKDITKVNSDNESKYVLLTGQVTTEEKLEDRSIGLTPQVPLLRLKREVAYYQWAEEYDKNKGAYKYKKAWVDKPIDSTKFKDATYAHAAKAKDKSADKKLKVSPHSNQVLLLVDKAQWDAEEAKIGSYAFSYAFVQKLKTYVPLKIQEEALPDKEELRQKLQLPQAAQKKPAEECIHISKGNVIYLGQDPKAPQVGDVKLSYSCVMPQIITAFAKQEEATLCPIAENDKFGVPALELGAKSPLEMGLLVENEDKYVFYIFGCLAFACGFFALLPHKNSFSENYQKLVHIGLTIAAALFYQVLLQGVVDVHFAKNEATTEIVMGCLGLVAIGGFYFASKRGLRIEG